MGVQQPGYGGGIAPGGSLTEGIAVGVHRAPKAVEVHGLPQVRDGENIGGARLHPVNGAGERVSEFLHRVSAPTGSLYPRHDGGRVNIRFRVSGANLLGGVVQQFVEYETSVLGVQGADVLHGAQGDGVTASGVEQGTDESQFHVSSGGPRVGIVEVIRSQRVGPVVSQRRGLLCGGHGYFTAAHGLTGCSIASRSAVLTRMMRPER